MINPTGNLVLNGITDAELVKILEVKMRHEHSLNFNPQQMQPTFTSKHQVQPQPGQPMPVYRAGQPQPQPQQSQQEQIYNNVIFQWSNENGLEAVQEIVHFLLKKEEAAKAVGQ
jgi:hypothetical protein